MNKKLFNILLILTLFFTFSVSVLAEEDEELLTTFTEEQPEETISDDIAEKLDEEEKEQHENSEYVNEETKYKAVIKDEANLLTDDEEVKLKDQMTGLTEYGNIILITLSENSMSTESYAERYYHSNYGTVSGTIFVIDMDNRRIYMFSDGANYRTITSEKAYIITDNVYNYASREKYYECVHEAFREVQVLLEGGKIAEPMRHISNFVLALTCGFFVCFLIVHKVSKIKEASAKEILNNCGIKFDIGEITGEKVGEHRVYNPHTDSSSGGGGGGGGGGGSSGGGGGHSF